VRGTWGRARSFSISTPGTGERRLASACGSSEHGALLDYRVPLRGYGRINDVASTTPHVTGAGEQL